MCSFITGYGQNETLSCLIELIPVTAAQILKKFLIGCDFHGIRDKAGPVTVERS